MTHNHIVGFLKSQLIWNKNNGVFITRPGRVKSGNFRHQVNSDIHMQTVEISLSHQDFHCSLS